MSNGMCAIIVQVKVRFVDPSILHYLLRMCKTKTVYLHSEICGNVADEVSCISNVDILKSQHIKHIN